MEGPNCEPGAHLMNNGTYSMSTLDRVTQAGIASHKTDPNCEQGVHLMNNGEISTSIQIVGIASHETDPNCEQGVHWIEEEYRFSMSTLDRATKGRSASLGSQRIEKPIKLLVLQSSNVRETTSVPKYSRNHRQG